MYSNNDQFKERRIRAVKEDVRKGGSELSRSALEDLLDYAEACDVADTNELKSELLDLAMQMQLARPSMLVLWNILQRWIERMSGMPMGDLAEARQFAAAQARDLATSSVQAVKKITQQVSPQIVPGSIIMVHSYSTTVMQILESIEGIECKVIMTESRPGIEGRRMARTLSELKIPTTYITEAQIGNFIYKADLVLMGADSVLVDGSVINKAGTYLMALAAREVRVPFWVVAESYKHSSRTVSETELEEMEADELQLPSIDFVTPRNVYFDVTPAELVSAWVDENGYRTSYSKPSEPMPAGLLKET
ncbi:translation initiation factor eIF-2B [Oceanospirillum sediminis]|uniref:Translation initiation factor eIF-2B n=1 Tax=Oceanospirillum sediminis TaxID=2760088 RepID=A0A839INL3_9GAMM|nr:translation initiation factor eIF-2B [Oceanospirillum sediminis]MBB1486284.1 translation initiation factor eIF-2B [Oceanospirillum sediminis]